MCRIALALLALLAITGLCTAAARDLQHAHQHHRQEQHGADSLVASLLGRAQAVKQRHHAQSHAAHEDQDADDSELSDEEEEERNIMLMEQSRMKKPEPEPEPDDKEFCYGQEYRKRTLKLVREMPFVGLFRNLPKNNVRFEASGICIAKDFAWVVFDSFRDIARLDLHFNYFGDDNIMVPDLDEPLDPGPEGPAESQFEGLAYIASKDMFLVVRETFTPDGGTKILSRTEEIRMNEELNGFHTIRECVINFEFEDTNKGFEGIYYFEKDGKPYFMGLCESNYCKTVLGDDPPGLQPGHGRLVVAELREEQDGTCEWDVVKVINIPRSAYFLDYSVISFNGYMGKNVAIASQEDAAVWVGKFDWERLEFFGKSRVLYFPRNEHCEKLYCNVEGLQFIDAQRVVVTSDKSKPTQPHHCMHKDQSLAVMSLPKYLQD